MHAIVDGWGIDVVALLRVSLGNEKGAADARIDDTYRSLKWVDLVPGSKARSVAVARRLAANE